MLEIEWNLVDKSMGQTFKIVTIFLFDLVYKIFQIEHINKKNIVGLMINITL